MNAIIRRSSHIVGDSPTKPSPSGAPKG
jgi:hypothetical protein